MKWKVNSFLLIISGSIHAGVGNTALNKILSCADIPQIHSRHYKRYEKIIGTVIEEEAKNSCKRAAEEEKRLVIENIKQLCTKL